MATLPGAASRGTPEAASLLLYRQCMASEKLRLGGMALRNGLLIHGPTHWAAAVRRPDGRSRLPPSANRSWLLASRANCPGCGGR